MKIAGLQKTSLIDYPNHIAAIIFTQGCNLRCPYCHNSDLVSIKNADNNYIHEEELFFFLNKRKHLLDGVSITGGEPTLQTDLFLFIEKLKKQGFKVKLDTNGTKSELIKDLLAHDLLDYIAMDIKFPLSKYKYISVKDDFRDEIKKSINLIKKTNIDYEFRTTVVPSLHQEEDLKQIALLIQESKLYFLQNFKPNNSLDSKLNQLTGFSLKKLKKFKSIVSPYVQRVEIRD